MYAQALNEVDDIHEHVINCKIADISKAHNDATREYHKTVRDMLSMKSDMQRRRRTREFKHTVQRQPFAFLANQIPAEVLNSPHYAIHYVNARRKCSARTPTAQGAKIWKWIEPDWMFDWIDHRCFYNDVLQQLSEVVQPHHTHLYDDRSEGYDQQGFFWNATCVVRVGIVYLKK